MGSNVADPWYNTLLDMMNSNFMINESSTITPCFDNSETNDTLRNCTDLGLFSMNDFHGNFTNIRLSDHVPVGMLFFRYVTPLIFLIGVVGNCLSLRVFLTKNMRQLSASVYLGALSTADLTALFFYVLTEWIKRGLPSGPGELTAPFLVQNGVCQALLYIQYISRFNSAWLVACFTFERYIGVCHPLKRKGICDARSSRKIVFILLVVSLIVCAFKPWLSRVYIVGKHRVPWCTRNMDYNFLTFILDCLYGVSITILPFFIITTLNTLIIRKLFVRNKRHRECKIVTEESIIRLEFTIILIVVSFCFIAFNTPFSIAWYKQYIMAYNSKAGESDIFGETQNLLLITRTIFYMNYCINFFLYSITGTYFRKELRMLFTYKSKAYQNYHRCSVHNSSHSNTPQSWL